MSVKRAWSVSALVVALAMATVGHAKPKGRATVFEADWASAPSARYGAMDGPTCRAELRRRKVTFVPVKEARGVLAPLRIPEGVGGVTFHTLLPKEERRSSPWEVFDCRLVLALHDFAAILRRHGVDEVVIFSAWRPPPKRWPEGKLARRHPGALAVDVMRLRQRPTPPPKQPDGEDEPEVEGKAKDAEPETKPTWIDVKKDFHGRVGDRTCGPKGRGPRKKTGQAKALRAIVCEAAEARLFTSMLTPNYDRHHHDHLHLEVTPTVKWRLIR